MQKSPGEEYIDAEFTAPSANSVDWKNRPPSFKLYNNAEQIQLPALREQSSNISSDHPLTATQVAQFLLDVCALTHLQYMPFLKTDSEASPLDALPCRAVPSGGTLFPWECYLFVGAGQEFSAGIYHYDAAHHALDILRRGDYIEAVCSALARPPATRPAYVLAFSCFFWKDGFKYDAFSYRLQGFDVGAVIEQCMAVLDSHLLPATVSFQFLDMEINHLLGLHYLHESVYAIVTIEATQREENSIHPSPAASVKTPEADRSLPVAPQLRSIETWPLAQAVHSASLYRSKESFREPGCLPTPVAPSSLASHILPPASPTDLLTKRHQRHSAWGRFIPLPIKEQQLAQLLQACAGNYRNDLDGQASAMQHTQLYCVVNRVENVSPGFYYYNPRHHTLELVMAGDLRAELQRTLRGPLWRGPISNMYDLSVCFIPVGNYNTGFQVYGDRWYRIQNMEAGMLVQRLYLAAAAQDLGCRAFLGFHEKRTHGLFPLPEGQRALIQVLIGMESPAHAVYRQSLLL